MDVLGDGMERRDLARLTRISRDILTRIPLNRRLRPFTDQSGATYLIVMFLIVLMGISLMAISQQWSVIMKRDREAELAFRGTRIKEAIERYVADYEVLKATRPTRYPPKLEDLTKGPKRYLQVVYKDPITDKDFDLIKVGTDIRGVRSTSPDKPLDQVTFKGAQTYQAIRFEVAQSGGCVPNPANPLLPCTPGTQPTQQNPGQTQDQIPQ